MIGAPPPGDKERRARRATIPRWYRSARPRAEARRGGRPAGPPSVVASAFVPEGSRVPAADRADAVPPLAPHPPSPAIQEEEPC
jgi:hypothetical protein